jgi:SAM-dependent methyltransferase
VGQEFFQRVFSGVGIDIGCGKDILTLGGLFPGITRCDPFDKDHGDAGVMSGCVGEYDFVYSSNCLEHLFDPVGALLVWWGLVKRGGYLVVLLPDEDLYEQGVFPSRWNSDHKWTFTIFKNSSWCKKSINVWDLVGSLRDGRLLRLDVVDTDYNHDLRGVDQTLVDGLNAEAFIEFVVQKI